LNKTTNGTVTLAGANTYTGATTISAGTLAVTNLSGSATGTGAVAVNSGATLTGNGTVGNVTVNAGGILTPGSNGLGNLTMSNLTLATNSVTNLQFNGTANDQLTVTGTNGLTLGSGAILDIYQANTTTAFITPGTYQLIGYVGNETGAPGNLTIGTSTGGLNFNLSTSGNFLDLTIALANGPGSWSATGSGNWSNSSNWASGIVGAGAGNTAVFGTSITAPATVTLDGNETVGGLTFGNANSYTIAPGTGVLTLDNMGATAVIAVSLGNETISTPVNLTAGGVTAQVSVNSGLTISGNIGQTATAGVTKAGLGTLTLSGVNSYTGDTVITGGTLTDGVSNAIPSASNLTVNGTTADFNLGANQNNTVNIVTLDGNGSITGTGTSTLTSTGGFQVMNGTVTAILAGSGIALNKTTTGTVTLAGANTYTGATTISAGTLVLSPTGSLATTDTVNVATGAVLTVNNNGTIATLNTNGLINGNSTLTATTYNLNDGSQIDTSLGSGNLISNGNVGVNGTLASSNLTIQSGTMTLQQPNLLNPDATANISTGASLVLANGDTSILGLDGNGNINDTNGILNVTDGFGSFTGTVTGATATNGMLTSNGNLTIATGTFSSYPNGTLITGGTLSVDGTLTTPNVTVDLGGTLGGNGTISGNVINNGIVSPSDPSIMTISGNFNDNGGLDIEIGGTAGPGVNPNGNDEVVVGGKTIINPVGSILNLQVTNGFTSPARGTTFTFLSGAPGSISGHFGSITSNFATDLLVDLPTGQLIGTGAPLGSNLATNFPGANASQLAQLNQLQIAPDQFEGGDLLQLLLTNPSSRTAQILNQASPEAYAGLTDYALRTTRSYLKTALGLDPVVDSGNFEVIAGYNHYNGGSDSSQDDADYNLNSDGGILGFRAAVGHHIFLGLFGGGDTGSVRSTYLNSNDTGFVGGVFATVDPLDNHRLLGTASFTYGDLTNQGTRNTSSGTSYFSGVNSNSYLGTIGVQYVAIKQTQYSITPEIDISYGSTSVDGFTETNPAAMEALHVDGQNADSLRTDFIVNGQYNVTSQFGITSLFGISHDFENTARNVTANVANETTAVTVQAPGMGNTDYSIGLGLVYSPIKNLRLQIGYTAGFSTQAKMSNTLFVGGSYSW
jgi:autotransporter-associated beta strand protein